MAEVWTDVDLPAWIQAVAAMATVGFAWRLNEVTKQQASVAEQQAATAREQNAIAARLLQLEERRNELEHSRLTTLARRQARDVSNRLAVIARDLAQGIDTGMPRDFYTSKGEACRTELDELYGFHKTLAERDGKPTVQADYALEELTRAADELLQFGPLWQKLLADSVGTSRRDLAFSAHTHLCYAIVHLCNSIEPQIGLPSGIPPQTTR